MPNPLRNPTRTLALICLASAGWAFSFGLAAPLASIWLQDAGYGDSVIGLNTGTHYFGMALAAGLVPLLMRRWGRLCAVWGMILSGITVALFPWGGSFTGWFVLRALEGCAGAMSLIPMETLVNRNSPRAHRARNLGFYALAVTLGWALGNLIGLQMHENWPRLAFALGGCASLLSGLAVYRWLPWPGDPLEGDVSALALPWKKTILSFGSAWSQGFLEGTMVAFLSVYLLFLGWSDVRVSWLTSGILVGIILFQVPVAWLADKLGRTKVLLGCYGVTALGLVLAPFSLQSSWLSFWLFLVGAFSGAFYPLGLSILGERIPESGLARANARYLAINCLGSLCGPVITGSVMERFGKPGMFWSPLAAVILVLGCWLGSYWWSKPVRLNSENVASPTLAISETH